MNKSEEEGALLKTFEDMLYKTQNRRADITDRENMDRENMDRDIKKHCNGS